MPFARTDDGIHIHYKTSGDGPRNLLLMHGWAGSCNYWDEMLKYLELTGLRIIAVNLRGHGDSDKPQTGYTLERYALDMFTVADHAKADRFVVVGFSMSGKFAQYLSPLQPSRILGQILVAGCPASEIPFPAATHQDWINRAGNREKLIELLRLFLTKWVKPDVLYRWADDAVKVPKFVLDGTLKMCTQTAFTDRLKPVRTPTLVIGGVHDLLLTPEVLRRGMVASIPGARLALVDCNHEIPIEKPQELAALIETFLAGLGESSDIRVN